MHFKQVVPTPKDVVSEGLGDEIADKIQVGPYCEASLATNVIK